LKILRARRPLLDKRRRAKDGARPGSNWQPDRAIVGVTVSAALAIPADRPEITPCGSAKSGQGAFCGVMQHQPVKAAFP